MDTNPSVRRLWAETKVLVHEAQYRLVSLPTTELARAAQFIGTIEGSFAALIVEPSEVSLSVPARAWETQRSQFLEGKEDGPFRAISLDLDVNLSTWGYFAPATARLAAAGVSIVPQCAFLKDHLLVWEKDLTRAVSTLEELIRESQSS